MNKSILVQGGDGTAIPENMVGAKITFTARATTGSSGAWVVNSTKLGTLTTGVWSIRAYAEFSCNNAASVVISRVSTNSTADGSGAVASLGFSYAQVSNATNIPGMPLYEEDVVSVTSTQDLFAKSFSEDAAVNVTIKGFAIRIA